jgi:hypothetical protein
MLKAGLNLQESIELKCRECGAQNAFSYNDLMRATHLELDCSQCHYSACCCYWQRDVMCARKWAASVFLARKRLEEIRINQEYAKSARERTPVTTKLRFAIFARDKSTCQYCGAKAPDVLLHVDHIKPRALGGLTVPDNLTTACERCNIGKGALPLPT